MAMDRDKENQIIIGMLVVGALMILGSYRKREVRKVQGRTRYAMDQIRVSQFDKADRAKVRKLLKKYGKKAYKARRKKKVYKAQAALDRSMAGFRTTADKLMDAKLDAAKEIYSSGASQLGKAGADLSEKYIDQIKAATKIENVTALLKQFQKKAKTEAKKQSN